MAVFDSTGPLAWTPMSTRKQKKEAVFLGKVLEYSLLFFYLAFRTIPAVKQCIGIAGEMDWGKYFTYRPMNPRFSEAK